MLNLDEFYKARYVLGRVVRRTDLIYAHRINPEGEIYLKPENLQVTGSFKVRGAYYKISQLSDEEKEKGVVACSAGNHAQGVALGASGHGIKSLICLPEGAPISKVESTRRLGAEICLVPGVYDDAYRKALELRDQYGYTFIHPFNDEHVIAGQGTIGLELLEQLPEVDTVIVPVGGGGLASGIAFAIKTLNPKIKVYGVQATGAPSMLLSIEHHRIECLSSVATIADGIAVKEPGEMTYNLVNAAANGKISAKVEDGVDWIHDFNTSVNRLITFEVDANDVEEEREATVTVTYSAEGMSDATATFKVVQDAKAPEAFDMSVGEIGSTWFVFNLIPEDLSMEYLLVAAQTESLEGYVDLNAYIEDMKSEFSIYAEMTGLSLKEILTMFGYVVQGSLENVIFPTVAPDMQYTVLACGINENCDLITPVSQLDVTTLPATTPIDNQISVNVTNITSRSAAIGITTTTPDAYALALFETAGLEGASDAEIEDYLIQGVAEGSVNYLSGDLSSEEGVFEGMSPETSYTVVVMGVAGDVATTDLIKKEFTTTEAGKSDVAFSLEYKYFEGADVQDFYEVTGYEGLAFLAGRVNTEGEGFYWNVIAKSAFDELEGGDLTDEQYIDLLLDPEMQSATQTPFTYICEYGEMRLFGVAYDENGNFGPVWKEDVNLTPEGVSPASELESFLMGTRGSSKEFAKVQLQRLNIKKAESFKQVKMSANELKDNVSVKLNVRSMVKK